MNKKLHLLRLMLLRQVKIQAAINYVSIELPYLEAPAEQNIVVSFGNETQEITDTKVTYVDEASNEYVISLLKKRRRVIPVFKDFFSRMKKAYIP